MRTVIVFANREHHDQYRSLVVGQSGPEMQLFGSKVDGAVHRNTEVVVVDCGTDNIRGLKTVREIKSAHPEIPVILIMDSCSAETAIKAFRSGARECFMKPVNLVMLQEAAESLMKIKRATRGKRSPYCTPQDEGSLTGFETASSDKPPNVLRVVRFIRDNLLEDISLEDLAEEANLSKHHFCRFFKSRIGMSPMKFVSCMRIERAKELLRIDSMPVSVAASEAGFNDLGSFIRQFKNHTGMTPTGYKKSFRHPS